MPGVYDTRRKAGGAGAAHASPRPAAARLAAVLLAGLVLSGCGLVEGRRAAGALLTPADLGPGWSVVEPGYVSSEPPRDGCAEGFLVSPVVAADQVAAPEVPVGEVPDGALLRTVVSKVSPACQVVPSSGRLSREDVELLAAEHAAGLSVRLGEVGLGFPQVTAVQRPASGWSDEDAVVLDMFTEVSGDLYEVLWVFGEAGAEASEILGFGPVAHFAVLVRVSDGVSDFEVLVESFGTPVPDEFVAVLVEAARDSL